VANVEGRRSSFTLSGRIALVGALLIGLMASGPSARANAATISWTAQNQFSEGLYSQEDAIANVPQPLQRTWYRSTYLSDASASWPATVEVETMLAPSSLNVHPPTTPTPSGALSRYAWSVTTGAFIFISSNERPPVTPGFSVARELQGGRVVPAGASERRRFSARFVPDHAMPFYSVEIQFTARFGGGSTIPPMPVTPSDIACTPPPTFPQDVQRPQWNGSAAAGAEVRIDCDVTLTNTTASPATYTPSFSVFEGLGSSYEPLPAGATAADHVDPILGRTRYTVTPPSGTPFDAFVSNFRDRFVSLGWQNEPQRGTPWYATYDRTLADSTFDLGDSITNAPRAFRPISQMYIQSPGWPSRIQVQTTLPPSRLEPFPVVTPLVDGGVSTYTWEDSTTFVGALLSDASLVSQAPGFTLTRTLVGGREIAPHAVVERSFSVDVHLIEATQFMTLAVIFDSIFNPSGTPARPVIASNANCPGGQVFPDNPGTVHWFNLPTAAGSDAHLVCTVRLENTSANTASYMPDVGIHLSRSLLPFQPQAATSASVNDPALGTAHFSVTPPPGTQADLYLGRSESLQSFLGGQNAAAGAAPWNARITESRQYFAQTDDVLDVIRDFELSWNFSVFSPAGWSAAITASTSLNTTGWFAFPSVTPTTVGGTTTYRWTGTAPLQTFLSSLGFDTNTRVSTPDSLGVSVRRESVGGTRIDPGATVHRSYVVKLTGSTDTSANVSVFITSGTAGTPNPVLVTDQQCTGGTVLGGLPGGFGWFGLALPQGVEVRLECTATLTNTSSRPARYMPVVSVSRFSETSGAPIASERFEVDVPSLGTVTLEVTPPADTTAIGTLVNAIDRSVLMNPVNRALEPTELAYVGDTSAYHGEGVTLAARLRSSSLGTPFVGQTLRFEVDGNTYTAETGADGIARVSISGGLGAVGIHHVTVSFPENDFFLGATASADVTVLARPTALTYTGHLSSTFGFTTLSARLVDSRSGAPLSGRSVKFTIDGQDVGSATTNAVGDASLVPATPPLPTSRTVVATFDGDVTLAGSHVSAQLTIANSVGKVTADATTANGAQIALSIRSEGNTVAGDLTLVTPTRRIVAQIIALGLSSDGTRALAYGRMATGEAVLLDLTDAGEPSRNDRIHIRVAGTLLTGDGSLTTGNVQIHKLK
jgi:hypothetical protein